MPSLFDPIEIRGARFRNRVGVSPMCQYSCGPDGMPTDWHLVHLGSRATGGAGVVIAEATAVEPRGRISPGDTGLWSDAHVDAWRPITRFIAAHHAVPVIQLAHAGWKAGSSIPFKGSGQLPIEQGGWETISPSSRPFLPTHRPPRSMTERDIADVRQAFVAAARRAVAAGFAGIEIHGAHGYLLHSFYSPLSNDRTDQYGGAFDKRTRLIREVAGAVRQAIPDSMPLWARLSCADWAEGGWTIADSIELSRRLHGEAGVDVIDCSSGGISPNARIPTEPGYQAPFAEAIRRHAGIATAAVGLITDPQQAEAIIQSGRADFVLIARASLRDPYWPVRAARALGQAGDIPPQYARGW